VTFREEFERFRALRRRTPEEERRARRHDDIMTGLVLILFALAMPFLYLFSGVLNMMSGTSPLGWTITIIIAVASLAGGIRLLVSKR
jgi:hypothetical protein